MYSNKTSYRYKLRCDGGVGSAESISAVSAFKPVHKDQQFTKDILNKFWNDEARSLCMIGKQYSLLDIDSIVQEGMTLENPTTSAKK